jgi:large subunit ribosomal protein L1
MDKEIDKIKKEKKNFIQTVDLIVNLKNVDMKKGDAKFNKNVKLPFSSGKNINVGVIGKDGNISEDDIKAAANDKKKVKELIKYDSYICEAPLMPLVGKVLGRYLAPVGKMPKPFPPGADTSAMTKELENSVMIRVKDAPTVQCPVGKQDMDSKEIVENIKTVLKEIEASLPKGKTQIKNVMVKLTMSKPQQIEV